MRSGHAALGTTLLAFALSATHVRAQQTVAPEMQARRGGGGFSSDSTAFVPGKHVYLRSTKTLIGTITAVDERHSFPADRFPRARMKAVLIERRDGPRDWVPVERITRIYVVR